MEKNLKKLHEYFDLNHDLYLTEDQLLDVIHNVRKYDNEKKNSLFGIIDIVSKEFNVSINDIKGKSRKFPLPDARKCFYQLSAIFYPHMQNSEISAYVNADRTSVINGIKKSEELRFSDRNYNNLFNKCVNFLDKNETLKNKIS